MKKHTDMDMDIKMQAHVALVDFANELILGQSSEDDALEILAFIESFQFDKEVEDEVEVEQLELVFDKEQEPA